MHSNQETLRNVVLAHFPQDKWVYITDVYDLVEKNIEQFQTDDFNPLGEDNHQPRWKRNVRHVLQTLKNTGVFQWDGNSNYLYPSNRGEELENTRLPIRQGISEERFAQIQERRSIIGKQGEEWVVEYERNYLIQNNRVDLAVKVQRVSIVDIGLGYDILSYSLDDSPKYIEVKTTIGSGNSFELTENERLKCIGRDDHYIYFLKNFNPENMIDPIIITGTEISNKLHLEASSYTARIILKQSN